MPNLIYNSEIVASTKSCIGDLSTLFSAGADMTDCDGAVFMAVGSSQFMPQTSAIMHAQCSTALTGTYVNYGTTAVVSKSTVAMTGKPLVCMMDVYKPTKPYIRCAINHTSGNFGWAILKYGMRRPGSTGYRDDTRAKAGLVTTS